MYMYNNSITIYVPLLYQVSFFYSSMSPYDVHVHVCCVLKCPIDPIPTVLHVHLHLHVHTFVYSL